MQKALIIISLFSFSCFYASTCIAAPSKEKNLLILIAFETKGILTKQKTHLIKESISSRVKQSFKGIIQLQELKLVDQTNLINLKNETNKTLSATLFVTYEDNHFIIKINFADYENNLLFPTQQTTCINQEEIPSKSLNLIKEYLTPKATITKKITEDLYELQFESYNQFDSDYLSPKKGDYFQILRRTQTSKSNNIYKWTVLQLTDPVASNEKKHLFNSRLHTGIELPDLIGLKAIKIPDTAINIGFKITPKEQNLEVKSPESYFPVAVVLRSSFKVASNQEGFTSKTNNQGIFSLPDYSGKTFLGVAFVEIIKNSITIAQFPFFRTSNEQESITLNFEPEKPYEKPKAIWLIQVNDHLAFMGALFRELNKPSFKDDELKTRIDKIEKLAKYSFEKTNSILLGLNDLKLKWPDIASDNEIKLGEKKLSALLGHVAEVNNYQAKLIKIEADKNSPKRKILDFKIIEARRMAGDGDFPQAIELLESVFPDAPEVETELKQCKALWLNESAKVMEARKFLFGAFPGLSVSEFLKQSSKLISSVDICIAESDTAGLLKYQKHSRELYLQLDPAQNTPEKLGISPKESLEIITLLEDQNKRVKIFFESLNKKP
ncbi:MAG: hypothetical protein EXS07_03125 [Gemmataceae bacterium]|nr:hypothetical protein [Gemmataceae bacterium]